MKNQVGQIEQQRIRQVARQYIDRQLKGQRCAEDVPLHIALQARPTVTRLLLQHEQFKSHDTCDLFVMARAYVKGRLPIVSREVAVACLLSCQEYGHVLPEARSGVLQGRKFRAA